ncbi:fibroblast growth factor 21-like [Scleropages formosus]|uniref:Fibroblast growth factor 21-like n=1 Tax=Scleropages formosus TaxID=113540 RepID=A0A0P7U987_SCLFO|nr:fibroblast growth factor 21-like [Scleropages formosus]
MLHLCLCALLLRLCAPLGVPNSPPLHFHDQVRQRHLYTESSRRGLFLEIAPDGAVRGTPVQTLNSVLELRSVQAGQTVIQGVRSSLYLCVDGDGHLRGRVRRKAQPRHTPTCDMLHVVLLFPCSFFRRLPSHCSSCVSLRRTLQLLTRPPTPVTTNVNQWLCRVQRRYTEADCTFRELLLADGYTVFLSPHHGLPITLASKVSVTNRPLPFSHFLPVRNSVTLGGGRRATGTSR